MQIAGSKRKEWIRQAREDAQQKKKKKKRWWWCVCVWGGCLPSQSSHFEVIAFLNISPRLHRRRSLKALTGHVNFSCFASGPLIWYYVSRFYTTTPRFTEIVSFKTTQSHENRTLPHFRPPLSPFSLFTHSFQFSFCSNDKKYCLMINHFLHHAVYKN